MKTILLFLSFWPFFAQSQTHNIVTYGAKGDGGTVNTQAIQKAIDACHQQGGGTVLVPNGTFVSGNIVLKSRVNLYLEHGAVLKGSPDLADYQVNGTTFGLIYAEDAEDIAITGEGEINGNGMHFMTPGKIHNFVDYDTKYIRQGENFMKGETGIGDGPIAYEKRPDMMVVIMHCERVKIKDVRMTDSPSWTVRLGECENVDVSNVTILNNLLVPNSDGVHCTTSRNVTIANCNIQAGDDAVIVTGFGDETGVHGNMKNPAGRTYRFGNKTKIAENIVVTNCVLQSRSAGIRVGYGTNDIRNLIFSNLVIFESNRGIGVFARDGHTIENITFDNIHIQTRLHTGKWWGRGEPIHVSAARQAKDTKPGVVRGIRFANVKAFAEAGMVVYGTAESVIENIDFENVELTLANGKLSERYGGNFDMRPVADKSIALFRHDIPGLYAGHVKDLTVKGLEVKWADAKPTDYYSNVVFCENFEDVTLDGIKGKPAHQNRAAIVLMQGKNVRLENSVASPGTGTFVETSKVTGQKIANNDTRNAQRPLVTKP